MLGTILKIMYDDSQAVRNRPVRKTLKGGLRIMLLNDGHNLVLVLSRDAVHPSEQEFHTVLAHLPFKAPAGTKPERVLSDHRPSLRARLEIPKQVQLPLI
jgi:hypothetical protein